MKKIIIKSLLASTLLSLVLINNTEVASAANNTPTLVSASKTFQQLKSEHAQNFYASYNRGEITLDRFGLYLGKLNTCTNQTDLSELLDQINNIDVKVLVEAQNEAKSVLLRMKNENIISSEVFKDASRVIDKAFDCNELQEILKEYQTAYNGLSLKDVKRSMINYNLELANTYRITFSEFNLNLFNISTATSVTELQEYFFYNLATK